MESTPSRDVLEFWFGSATGAPPDEPTRKRWWKKDPDFDHQIRDRFAELHEDACAGKLDAWTDTARGTLALVILLDQFSRNLHRGSPRSWSSDRKAQAIVNEAIEAGQDEQLADFERLFLYMPLMHAENLQCQTQCLEKLEQLAQTADGTKSSTFASNVDYARQHLEIIKRFGRFPHRNEVLGRTSTEEEIEFLKQPGSSF